MILTNRLETPLILTISAPKANSAVQQLFNSSRPPPPAIEPQLVTSETLRYFLLHRISKLFIKF